MSPGGIYFNGRMLIQPQAATKIDDSGMFGRGQIGANTLALIGESTGGQPGQIMWFTDPSYAKAILRSGDLLQAVQRAYAPSNEVQGAYLVGAIRVNHFTDNTDPCTQSTLDLDDSNSDPQITLTSVDWGVWNNQIRARVETGTDGIGKKITISYGTSYDQGDQIFKKSLAVSLTDPQATAGTLTIGLVSSVRKLSTSITGGTAGNLAIILSDYPTIQLLADVINATAGYRAEVITSSPATDLTDELDDVTALPIISSEITTLNGGYTPATNGRNLTVADNSSFNTGDYITVSDTFADDPTGTKQEMRRVVAKSSGTLVLDSALSTSYVTASIVRQALVLDSDLQAIIDWVNGGNTGFVTAAHTSAATTYFAPANVGDTYLSGGSDGVTVQADWDAALTLLQSEDTSLVSCISPEPSVWASLSAHCEFMSTVGKMERRGFCGGFSSDDGYSKGLGKWSSFATTAASVSAMLKYAFDLNSDRMYYVGPGFVAYDLNGNQTTYSGAISAALVAGMAAGVDVAEALTHDTISVLGLEYNLKPADLDRLLQGGVLPLEYAPGVGYRVCQSISTWLVDDRFNRRELSTGRVSDYIARNVRTRLDRDFVGRKGTITTLISIKNATVSVLNTAFRDGYLAGDAKNPPFKNIQCRLDGDVCYVDFECSPVIPINYIPITIHLTIFTSTLTA
jgi:hypothetical protein